MIRREECRFRPRAAMLGSPPMTEDIANPQLRAFRDLWESKRRDGKLPARADFDIDDFRPFLGRIVMLDVVDGGRDFRFRLYGTIIVDEYKRDMTGKLASEFRPDFREPIMRGYKAAHDTKRPHVDRIDIDAPDMRYVWDRIVVPLAGDGETVDIILVYSQDLVYDWRGGTV
jgi:hypothetical protein